MPLDGRATGPSSTAASASGANAAATTAPTSAGAVALAVEMTQGPYYLDLNLVRPDIREDRVGVPLALDLTVVDPTGAPVKDAVVDIWHCDANGVYSGFVSASTTSNGGAGGGGGQGGTPPSGGPGAGGRGGAGNPGAATKSDDSTFLRGSQLADAAGKVSFTTIYPGWYTGRAVHIHVLVHVGGKVTHIGQFFFDDALTDKVYAASAPYSARPARDLRNAADGIFQGGGAASVLPATASGDGYRAALTMAVKPA